MLSTAKGSETLLSISKIIFSSLFKLSFNLSCNPIFQLISGKKSLAFEINLMSFLIN